MKKLFAVFLYIFLAMFLDGTVNSLSAQVMAPDDSVSQKENWQPVLKSALVPGWGQINQERLTEGLFFYFSGLNYYYRTFYHLYQYIKDDDRKNKELFQLNLSVSLFLHGLNILDAADAHWKKKDKGWQGGLFDDRPLKSPLGAAARSAMLPGWGQVYNHAYWKAGVYFLANGYIIYRIINADQNYRDTGQKSYKSERSDYSWLFGLSYLITMTDAYAGAYLYRFDEAMELTVIPKLYPGTIALGLHVRF